MQLHQIVKNAITEHKQKIELTQWAIISGISSLFYSEFIRRFKHKEVPVKMVMVPAIKNVANYLKQDSDFMQTLSSNLITDMQYHYLMQEYDSAPELVMFKEENIEVMKTIFDLYIMPNISRRIPETFALKFGLNNENQQIFRETWELHLFDEKPINTDQYNYIVHQIVLQLLMLLPTMKKEVEIPEDHVDISMTSSEILTIANENAICPIHFSPAVIGNDSVIELLSFVTNTNIKDMRIKNILKDDNLKRGEKIDYLVTTGAFNQVMLTRLIGIEYNEEKSE